MEKSLNKLLKDSDLSAVQGIVLVWLNDEETKELPIKAIEKRSVTSQPTTHGIINRLEQKGLVSSYLTQQRTKIVKITDDGLSLVGKIQEYIQIVDEMLFKGFTQEEIDLFLDFLKRAEDNILNRN